MTPRATAQACCARATRKSPTSGRPPALIIRSFAPILKSGRKALFLGRRPNAYVLGLEVAESEALLDALWAHATQPRFVMCHEWKVGDLLMWNNLSVLHRRDPFDPKTRRVMHRSQIKGNERIA